MGVVLTTIGANSTRPTIAVNESGLDLFQPGPGVRYLTCQSSYHTFTDLRRSALPITDTDDRLIAAAAKIGEIKMPKTG